MAEHSTETVAAPATITEDGPISFIVTFPSRQLLNNIAYGVTGYSDCAHQMLREVLSSTLNYCAPPGQPIRVRPYTPSLP